MKNSLFLQNMQFSYTYIMNNIINIFFLPTFPLETINSHSHRFHLPFSPCVSRARREIGLDTQEQEQQTLPERNVAWMQVNKKDNILPSVSSKDYLPVLDILYSGLESVRSNFIPTLLITNPEGY